MCNRSVAMEREPYSLVAQTVKASAYNVETWVHSLGWEDPPGEGNGSALQYSCLGKPIDRGAWQAAVHGVTKELDRT